MMKWIANRVVVVIVAVLVLLPNMLYSQMILKSKESGYDINVRKMYHLFYTLNRSYVEELNYFNLIESSVKDVLSNLDPFAIYLTPDEVKEVKESFYSVNSIFQYGTQNPLLSYTPVSMMPKQLREPFDELFAAAASDKQSGQGGSVDVAYMITSRIGYVKINRFSANTFTDMKKALASIPLAKALILDLRGNGGGFLTQAIDVTDIFLPMGRIITYTEGRTIARSDVHSRSGGAFEIGDVVVLVDEYTASASELVAGALQDWDRASIIGRQTYGKGLVQQQIEFEDGSAMRVTVARYHTPCGRVIQKPYDLGEYAVRNDGKREMKNYTTLTKGRKISSDGGIMPDIIIPTDSSNMSFMWAALVEQGYVIKKVIDYYSKNELMFQRSFPTFQSFAQNYTVPDYLIVSILGSGKGIGIVPMEREIARMRRIASVQIKAVLAEKIWGDGSFYKVLNMQDDNKFIQAALVQLSRNITPAVKPLQ